MLPKWAAFSISYAHPEYFTNPALFSAMGWLSVGEVFRVLRILKLAKNFTGLKVLILTVRASLQEMALLLFIVIIGSMMFAVGIFYSEFDIPHVFPDMAIGSYWALITMTSVGYGDMVPQTAWGRFIGIMCALTGIFCTGLPIPIIANNFDLYYSYARIRKAMKEREKENESFLANKLRKNGRHLINVTQTLTAFGKAKTGDNIKVRIERPARRLLPPPPGGQFLINIDEIPPKHREVIRRTLYRTRDRLARRARLRRRECSGSSESTTSLHLSIPSTDVTDISSLSSAHGELTASVTSPPSSRVDVRRKKRATRNSQVSPSDDSVLTSRAVIIHGMEDLDLM